MGVVDVKMRSIQAQINNVVEFLTTPKGIFETIDNAVKTFRQSNREILTTVSVPGVRGRILRR